MMKTVTEFLLLKTRTIVIMSLLIVEMPQFLAGL